MPNDTLDEIEAKWNNAPFTLADRKPTIEELEAILQSEPQGKITIEPNGEVTVEPWTSKQAVEDIRTLIEMVRARDRVVTAARQMERSSHTSHWDRTGGSGSGCPACLREIEQYRALRETLAALDTPPAQEPTE